MDYKEINRKLWNDMTGVHVNSGFYDVPSFIDGKTSLKHVELDLLGDMTGNSVIHLQCHFGMDTISLSRMGLKATGVDLSDRAIEEARILANKCNQDVRFINADIYDLPNVHNEKYDIVYTSYGTIGWLPDLDKWAATISHFLKPAGNFLIIDFHPVIWMMDYDFTKIEYGYFNTQPFEEISEGSYANRNAKIKNPSVSWNHHLSEIIQSLINAGLVIDHFSEYDYSVYDCFNNTIEIGNEKYMIKGLEGKIPMMYSIQAHKQ